MIRWYLDLAIVGRTVVGRIWQGTAKPDAPKGAIQPEATWYAVGMREAWSDTDLGNSHRGRVAAMKTVADWYAANEGKQP